MTRTHEETFGGKRVLITGGLGFIGSNLAIRLVELGAEVTILDALLPNMGGNHYNIDDVKDQIIVEVGDIRDEDMVGKLVVDKDYIFNLAAQLSHVDSMTNPLTDLDINCRGHIILLEACREHNDNVKIVYTGTRSQYGRAQHLPVDEKHPIDPTDTNGITKHACEQYHLLYHRAYGMRTTSLRLTNTYGPRHQMRHPRQGFIGWFIRKAMDDETIQLFGDGSQLRDINYVDDVVEAILLSAASKSSEGEAFNLGGQSIRITDLVKIIMQAAGKGRYELYPMPEERRKIDIGDYVADISKINGALGWKPTVSIEDGIRKTIEFYEVNRSEYW